MMELTLIEAMCILKIGWKTDEEKELCAIANDILIKESKILHLKYQKVLIENKLSKLKSEFKVQNEFEQVKEMENQHNISFLEWIRGNAVEVQDGWEYLGKKYTDKQIIEFFNTPLNLQDESKG
jgi:hypothetical protein